MVKAIGLITLSRVVRRAEDATEKPVRVGCVPVAAVLTPELRDPRTLALDSCTKAHKHNRSQEETSQECS